MTTHHTAMLCAIALLGGGCSGSKGGDDSGTVGPLDGGVMTALPLLPTLSNVQATENDDSASITFDPFDGALDYRVYPLPADGDIAVAASGAITIHNATYRCAGNRETPTPNIEGTVSPGAWVTTKVADTIGGYARTMDDATLGYVYTHAGSGLLPVYALGESDPNADNSAYFARWAASRTKRYTTSETERTQLLADHARDDGIAFYVPATADATTTQIFVDEDGTGTQYVNRYYLADGAEAAMHPTKTAAFLALAAPADGTEPLMRVFYANNSGWSHDELAAGKERFNRNYNQGDGLPEWSLLWTGITGPTTLVVEALDTQCPYQGHLSPQSIPSVATTFGTNPLIHEPYVTIDDMRAASTTTEVFVNGQAGPRWPWDGMVPGASVEMTASAADLTANTGAGLPLPKAIARTFIGVAPKPHAQMDFFADFSPTSTPETFTTIPCGVPGGNCFATWRQQSPTYDQMFIDVESGSGSNGLFATGQALGEYLVTYGDVGADTNGKYRLTPNQQATMNASSFLHVTMEVDAYSTARRYPQILISDQVAPVQYALQNGHTFIVQTRGEATAWAAWPLDYEFQICNLRTWDVNNQCPVYDLYHLADGSGTVTGLSPGDEVGEHASVDHRVTFDVYVSTQRAYLFLDGNPYGCADMPATGGVPAGPVSVTYGDVLYHSAVDADFAFHQRHLQIDTRRHYDNLGFSSGVSAPTWDESRFPCVAAISP